MLFAQFFSLIFVASGLFTTTTAAPTRDPTDLDKRNGDTSTGNGGTSSGSISAQNAEGEEENNNPTKIPAIIVTSPGSPVPSRPGTPDPGPDRDPDLSDKFKELNFY